MVDSGVPITFEACEDNDLVVFPIRYTAVDDDDVLDNGQQLM